MSPDSIRESASYVPTTEMKSAFDHRSYEAILEVPPKHEFSGLARPESFSTARQLRED